MTPERRSHATRTKARPVVIHSAYYLRRTDARRGEDLLGRLCADGDLDILDGTLLDWPLNTPAPVWRPLRNLPRLAALTQSVWASVLRLPTSDISGHSVLPPLAAPMARGQGAVVAICTAHPIDRVRNELAETGAAVRTTAVSAEQYNQLRTRDGSA